MPDARAPLVDRVKVVASLRNVVIALATYGVLLVALLVSSAQVSSHAADFTKPDLIFGYDHATVVAALTALGEAGRSAYLLNLVIDTIEPAALAVATVLVVARAFPAWLVPLSVAPVAFFLLDVVENLSIGVMLQAYPDVPPGLVAATSPITMLKLTAFLFTFPALAVGVAALVAGRPRLGLRVAVWAIAVAVAATGVVTLGAQPPIFTPVASSIAALWALLLVVAAERQRSRTPAIGDRPGARP